MAQIKQSAKYPQARNGSLEGPLHQFLIDGSRVLKSAAAKAGTFVTRGATAGQCKPPTTAAEVNVSGLGFLVADSAKGANGTANEYAVDDAASVVLEGPGVWCVAQEALAAGDPVWVVHGATGRGMIRNDLNTDQAAQLFGATVQAYIADTTWGGTGIALINMPRVADFS